jgi:predicted nicotinamide N-methyase
VSRGLSLTSASSAVVRRAERCVTSSITHRHPRMITTTSSPRLPATCAVCAASICLLLYLRWRSQAKQAIQYVLRAAEASVNYNASSPIYMLLLKMKTHTSEHLTVQYVLPPDSPLESLFCRIIQKDVAKGCIDPDLLGTDTCRDAAIVRVCVDGSWREMRVPIFMAHLVNPLGLCDPEADNPAAPVWADGSWTGTLLWDSAAHVCELMLAQPCWRARLRGASCLELGCGLGLPGMVASLLGAAPVLLTDRLQVAEMAEAGCRANSLKGARGVEFDWDEAAARQLVADHFGGRAPSLILACDCIFEPLFGEAHLLLRMLVVLADAQTTVIPAPEIVIASDRVRLPAGDPRARGALIASDCE